MVPIKHIQAQPSASVPVKRTRRRRIKQPVCPAESTTKGPLPPMPSKAPLPPPPTLSLLSSTSQASSATTKAPAIPMSSTTNSLTIKFDPLQIALETFDSVIAQSLSSTSNLNNSVTVHVYRSMFKETIIKQVKLYTSPLTPSDLIDVTTSSLKSIGLF